MVERLPAEAVVCRFGGDEFLVICPCGIQEEALAFSAQIEQSLLEKSIAASIGTAVYAGTEDEINENITLEKLVKMADARMYRIRWVITARNNPCGEKEQDRDEAGRRK